MKQVAVIILSAFLATNAFAEWLPIGKTASGVWYVNFNHVERDGNYGATWVLQDFYKTQTYKEVPYRSSISKYRYDCSNQSIEALQRILYSGNMSQGKVVVVEKNLAPLAALSLPPESIGKELVKQGCNN